MNQLIQKHNILIVDDDEDLVIILNRLLKRNNFNTDYAYNDEQAIKKANEFRPDLILLDIKLGQGGREGITVIEKLRSDRKFDDTKIIVLSAKTQLHEINEGIEAGANYYLRKPLMFKDIVSTIKGHLS
ncbi:MAG: response regulator [Desulfobacteraceae bacterium]|nr:response regulator [Desulfobacteraceae bacterium]